MRVSRRTLLKNVGLVSAAGVAGSVLAACGDSTPAIPTTTSAAPTVAPNEAPLAASPPTTVPTAPPAMTSTAGVILPPTSAPSTASPVVAPTQAVIPTSVPPPTAAATVASAPRVTIEMVHPWVGDHGGTRAMDATARRYQELNPNVTIKQTVKSGDYEQNQMAAFAAGTVPDVMLAFAELLPAYADRGVLLPLGDYLKRDKIDLKDYFDIVVAQTSWAGQVYGMTHHPDLRGVVFRNTVLMQAAGIDSAVDPSDWDTLKKWGTVLTRKDGARISQLGWAPPWAEAHWAVLFPRANGAPLINNDSGRMSFDAAPVIEALEFIVQSTEGIAGGQIGLHEFESRQPGPGLETAYTNGGLGLAIGANWYLDRIVNGSKNEQLKKSRVSAMPGGPSAAGQKFGFAGGVMNVLPKGGKQSDAAWAYARWIAQFEGQMLIQSVSYDVAGHRQAARDSKILNDRLLRPEILTLLDTTIAPAHLHVPAWPRMRDEIDRVERAMLMKQMTPRQGATELQFRLQSMMDDYRSQARTPPGASSALAPAQIDTPIVTASPTGNLLRNGTFEADSRRTSISSSVANEWFSWFQHRGAVGPGSWLPEPEYGLATKQPGRAHTGDKAQFWLSNWAVHNAGVYQIVTVPSSAWVRFSAWMFGWSSESDQFGMSTGFHHRWLGIDPEGGTDAFSPRIVWSSNDRTMDKWAQLTVTTQARGGRVSVFVRSQPEAATKHNDVFIDDAELIVVPVPADPVTADLLASVPPNPAAVISVTPLGGSAGSQPLDLNRGAVKGPLSGLAGGAHTYFAFDYPGGETTYTINLQATPDNANALARVGFRVYGPRWNDVYVMSSLRVGGSPNIIGKLATGERGRYIVDLYNYTPVGRLDYQLWLTGPNGAIVDQPKA